MSSDYFLFKSNLRAISKYRIMVTFPILFYDRPCRWYLLPTAIICGYVYNVHEINTYMQELNDVNRLLLRTTNEMFDTVASALLDKVRVTLMLTYSFFCIVTRATLLYMQGGPKIGAFSYALKLRHILTNFQTFFTVRIRKKFIIVPLKIPPHLRCVVATLPCEMSVS